MIIEYIYECECGGTALSRSDDRTQKMGQPIRIDVEFNCSQLVMECQSCGKKYCTGDIEILGEDEI